MSHNRSKQVRALQRKKNRRETGQFLVEGEKSVLELLDSPWSVVELFASEAFLQRHQQRLAQTAFPITCATAEELTRLGSLAHNHSALALVWQRPPAPVHWQAGKWLLVLDQVQDPSNLGSLLRIADWYGITQVLCSPDTAEVYNPKTLAASKGSFLRVAVDYQPLLPWLEQLPATAECLGAFLQGENIHRLSLQAPQGQKHPGGVLVLGNEAQGISPAVAQRLRRRVSIPAFGSAESLNVALAAGIICDNLRRLQQTLLDETA